MWKKVDQCYVMITLFLFTKHANHVEALKQKVCDKFERKESEVYEVVSMSSQETITRPDFWLWMSLKLML